MIDIVICVDGTHSELYRNRSVENFYRSVKADFKIYRRGPQQGLTGSDWIAIRDEVAKELNLVARAVGEDTFFNGYECTIARSKRFRFIMAGHSRGGHIVINLAGMLKYRTHFMGLYDAVDRTNPYDIHQKMKVYNVDHIYHAVRDVSVGSRTSKKMNYGINTLLFKGLGVEAADVGIANLLDFDNTGLGSGDGGEYVQKSFRTSHGGIGGDVTTSTTLSIPVIEPLLADDSCAISMFNQSDQQIKKMAVCMAESEEADKWMRAGARKCGVRI
jgi:hypothetical protein